jgi:hypothetical protein
MAFSGDASDVVCVKPHMVLFSAAGEASLAINGRPGLAQRILWDFILD